jgi:hypothetical protein
LPKFLHAKTFFDRDPDPLTQENEDPDLASKYETDPAAPTLMK